MSLRLSAGGVALALHLVLPRVQQVACRVNTRAQAAGLAAAAAHAAARRRWALGRFGTSLDDTPRSSLGRGGISGWSEAALGDVGRLREPSWQRLAASRRTIETADHALDASAMLRAVTGQKLDSPRRCSATAWKARWVLPPSPFPSPAPFTYESSENPSSHVRTGFLWS